MLKEQKEARDEISPFPAGEEHKESSLRTIIWMPGQRSLNDTLTKYNAHISKHLDLVL